MQFVFIKFSENRLCDKDEQETSIKNYIRTIHFLFKILINKAIQLYHLDIIDTNNLCYVHDNPFISLIPIKSFSFNLILI